MILYVCKTCGRSFLSVKKPKCCYYDKMDHLENISLDDSIKMGLFGGKAKKIVDFYNENKDNDTEGRLMDVIPEFFGDYLYHPVTGESTEDNITKAVGTSLREWQTKVMESVWK